MEKCFIVVSGLPGSGKSTLARRLAPVLELQLLDKDTILEFLFDSKGVDSLLSRRALSRESDLILQTEALASRGAVLVSHWRLPGMPVDSGTPTGWLYELPNRLLNVHCECPPEVAAERFYRRTRHHGHLDHGRTHTEILASICETAGFGQLMIAPRIDVDTSQTPDLGVVLGNVHAALARFGAS